MHLRELALRNFRRFERARVEFPDGVIGVVGPNGAGKSTLVEAIGWALFGHDAARTTKDQIPRQGADGDVRVALEFALGDHAYRVVREMVGSRRTARGQLIVDGNEKIAAGAHSAEEVTAYVERLLGMDREAFFTSIVAKQNELDALSDMTPGQRKEVLMRMLDVDAVDRAIERVRQDRREVGKEIETLESTLKDPEDLAEERSRIAAKQRRLDARSDELAKREEELRQRVDDLEAERDELEEARSRHADARARLASAEETLEDLADRRRKLQAEAEDARQARERLEEMGDVPSRYEKARERFEVLDDRREAAAERRQVTRRLNELQQKRRDLDVDADRGRELEDALVEARDELEGTREEIRRVRSLLERVRSDRDRLEDRRDELAGRLETFDDLGPDSPCPTCHRPLGEAHPDLVERTREELADLDRRIERLDAREQTGEGSLTDLGEERDRLKARVEDLEEDLADWRDRSSRAETLAREARQARERLESLEAVDFDREEWKQAKEDLADLEDLRSEHRALSERASRLDGIEDDLADLEDRREQVEAARDEARKVLETTEDQAEAYRETVDALDEARDELLEIQEDKAGLEGERSRLEADRERLEEVQERQEEVRRRVDELEDRRAYLLRLAGARDSGLLPDFRRHLIARVRPALAETASALFTELTDGRYTDLDLDEEYNLLIHDDGQAYTQDRFSGGEVDLANLCLRLAVGRLIAERGGKEGLDVVVLDEVFGSQDRTRRANILRTMQELTAQFRQILVITHVEEVQDRLEHVLMVRTDDGTSEVGWG